MGKKSKNIKVKELAPKIKILEKKETSKDVSALEQEVEQDSFVPSNSGASAANVSIRQSNEVQVVREIPVEPVKVQDSEFMMSKSYSNVRQSSPMQSTRNYQSVAQAARSVDPGLPQNTFSLQQDRPNRFRSQELDSMRTDSLPDSKYQEFEALPEDNKNKRKLPWEI